MSFAEFNRYKKGIDLYEERNKEDTVIVGVREVGDCVRVYGIEVPGFMTFADYSKYLDTWVVSTIGKYMIQFMRDKKITSGIGATLPAQSCRKFHVRLVWLGYDKNDKTHTMLISTKRNKDYQPHFDVSDDPR
jgi:hypothetical protein